jgi:hypothetical protein
MKVGQQKTSAADNIRVAVRVRPPLENEIQTGNSFEKLNIDYQNKLVK